MRYRLASTLVVVPAAATGAACGSDPTHACDGVVDTCIRIAPGASAQEIQEAFITVQPGSTIGFSAGLYSLDRDLSLDVDNVRLLGTGEDDAGGTRLSFADSTGAQGILITGDDSVVERLAVEDAPGDALKWEGVDGVTVRHVRVEWTSGPRAENGAYGIYPVQCQNILIEDSKAIAASDAGIYVGQSDNIVVRRNTASRNVAGIEIENSTRADVYDNVSTGNTGGVLVFNLPGLQVKNGRTTRIFDNEIVDNNEPNFAPPGNIVGKVPTGTGFASIAAHEVEVFGNTIANHKSVNVAVVSYLITEIPITDAEYDPYSDTIYIHDNVMSGTSDDPTGELGFLLVQGMVELMPPPIVVPDVVWDGNADPAKLDNQNQLMPQYKLCIEGNGDADFVNLAWPSGEGAAPSRDAAPHDCTHPALPAVSVPGA